MQDESKLVAGSPDPAAAQGSVEGGSSHDAGDDTAALADPAEQLAALSRERDLLAGEKATLQDLLQRRQAEFENYRRRVERERAEIVEYGRMETALAILPVVDDFERALKAECADKDYARGMELIYQRLVDTLKRMGLETIDTANQKFDPNFHHAVQREESAGHEEDAILEEYQKGYSFRGKLLRPAMVKVAVKPAESTVSEV
jgi:molecular chaperone GrpE